MSAKETSSPTGHFTELFERARRALMERVSPALAGGLDPAIVPEFDGRRAGNARGAAIAAQLRVDERTRQVVVRLYDAHTGSTIRELPPRLIAAAASRLRPPIA